MKLKYKEAATNLARAKQPVRPKQADPLSSICAQRLKELRKKKLIHKTYGSFPSSLFQGSSSSFKYSPEFMRKRMQLFNSDSNGNREESWSKFLPQGCDEFAENPPEKIQKESEKDPPGDQTILENFGNGDSQHSVGEAPPFNSTKFDIDQFKKKLGIGVAVQEPVKKAEETEKAQAPKEEPRKTSLLPFPGRPFEQAPPRPQPKKISEYPPTCKVAGIYQWPPPRSEHRQWRKQMKQSRKLK